MKFRRAAGLGAAVVAMLGFAAAASAQRGFGGPGFDGAEARSNPLGLLMRIDVKSHLHVTLKQQQAIEEVLTGAQKRQQEQRQALFQNRPQPNNAQGLSRDERRQQMQQFFQQNAEQMRAGRQQFEGELSEQIKQILKPEQVSRLYQLDYQHRGPLALADPKVAQDVKLSPETQQEIQKIMADHRTQAGELSREFFAGFRNQAGQ